MKDFIAKMVVAISKNPEVPLHEAEAEAALPLLQGLQLRRKKM